MEENRKDNIKRDSKKDSMPLSITLQKEQLKISKKQLFHSRIITVLLLIMTLTIGFGTYTILPDLNRILTNLNEITKDINNQEPIDIESLNKTIEDLEKVLEPISKLLNRQVNDCGVPSFYKNTMCALIQIFSLPIPYNSFSISHTPQNLKSI